MGKDKQFHRGLIVSVVSKTSCHIYLVDYGEVKQLNTSFIFNLPEEFVENELYSVRVALAEPEGLELDERVTEVFKKLVTGKSFRCQGIISFQFIDRLCAVKKLQVRLRLIDLFHLPILLELYSFDYKSYDLS